MIRLAEMIAAARNLVRCATVGWIGRARRCRAAQLAAGDEARRTNTGIGSGNAWRRCTPATRMYANLPRRTQYLAAGKHAAAVGETAVLRRRVAVADCTIGWATIGGAAIGSARDLRASDPALASGDAAAGVAAIDRRKAIAVLVGLAVVYAPAFARRAVLAAADQRCAPHHDRECHCPPFCSARHRNLPRRRLSALRWNIADNVPEFEMHWAVKFQCL